MEPNMDTLPTTTARAGWPILDWAHATGIGRSMAYILLKRGELESVRIGKRRVITTPPAEFLDRLAREQRTTPK
jgi:hypothetical protein